MATPPRFFENNMYYHIYNRGNRKQQIFLQNKDYERFLEKVVKYKKEFPVTIVSYCLMPNHFHFLIQQRDTNAISRLFSNLGNSHSKYFNIKYETVGSLYQGRFKAKRVDKDEYLVHLSRYIHLNPVDLFSFLGKNIFKYLMTYKWSSLPAYLTGSSDEIVDPTPILSYFSSKNPIEDYKEFVEANIQSKTDLIIEHLAFEE